MDILTVGIHVLAYKYIALFPANYLSRDAGNIPSFIRGIAIYHGSEIFSGNPVDTYSTQ